MDFERYSENNRIGSVKEGISTKLRKDELERLYDITSKMLMGCNALNVDAMSTADIQSIAAAATLLDYSARRLAEMKASRQASSGSAIKGGRPQ